MGASFSAATTAAASALTSADVLPPETLPAVALLGDTFPETEAAGPLADRLASPALVRRVGGAAVAPVAARVGFGTALFAAFVAALVACVAPVAASDAFVLLVVTAVILAL